MPRSDFGLGRRAARGVAAAVFGLLLVGLASASPPGRNGRIAWSAEHDESSPPMTTVIAVTLAGETRTLGAGTSPSPSPDGKAIAVAVPVDDQGNTVVVLADAAGGNRRNVPCHDLAWSPDSKEAACLTEAHDLVVVDAATGKVIRTLARLASGASWSPDGRWIAFLNLATDPSSLVVVKPDGSGKKVVARDAFSTPSWSPDSTKLVFSSLAGSDNPDLSASIYVADLLTGTARKLPTENEDVADEPQFSPDGTKIAYHGSPDVRGEALAYSVYVIGADGTGRRKIGPGTRPLWSPDGRRLAYLSRSEAEIFISSATGGGKRVFARAAQSNMTLAGYAWLPQSQTLLYATAVFLSDDDPEIYTSGSDGTGIRALTDNDLKDEEPAWSPDGKRIAWNREAASGTELWVMNANGSGQHRLATRASRNGGPAWSPDGKRIAFVTEGKDRDGNYGAAIAVVASSGGRVHLVTELTDDMSPAWSPDGRTIVFARPGFNSGNALYSIRPDGTGLHRLGARKPADEPEFSPDGRRIAYSRYVYPCGADRCPVAQLWVMRSNGTGSRKRASGFGEPAWSPDGRLIYGTGGVRVRVAGGPVQRVRALKDARSISWQRLRR